MKKRKMNVKFRILALLLFVSCGCSSNPVVINYSPSTLIERKGVLSVLGFSYKMKDDGLVMENEIQKTTIGDLIIDKKVSDLVENAIKLELKFAGISVSNKSNNRLSGDIERLFFDDLGVNLVTDLKVKYILTRQDKECFTRTISTSKKSPKFSNPTGQISETIKENIETLLRDEKFVDCIE